MSKLTSDLPRGPSLSITVTKALYLAQYNPANTSVMAAGKMEDKFGAFLQCVRLITLANICGRGGVFAAEEGHGPEDINFVIEEEGESDIGALDFQTEQEMRFDSALRGEKVHFVPFFSGR